MAEARESARRGSGAGFDDIVPFIMFALFLFVFFSMLSNARGGGRRIYRGGRGPIVYLPPSNDTWSGGSSWGGGWGSEFLGRRGGGGFSGGGGSSGGGGASGDW